MQTPARTNVAIVDAICTLANKDDEHFGAAVRMAGSLIKPNGYDWHGVASDLLAMARALASTKKSLPLYAVAATIESILDGPESIDEHIRDLTHEIRRMKAVSLDSAWCGEQDAHGARIEHLEEIRDEWLARQQPAAATK